jgi:hypothetical protein
MMVKEILKTAIILHRELLIGMEPTYAVEAALFGN